MKLIKLNATNSTNAFLKRLVRENNVEDNTVVTARYQTGGKGQMGNHWNSEPGKNLMFSVFRRITFIDGSKQFYISMAVAMAVYEALKNMNIPDLAVKWPNDILSGNKKIGGILIENRIKGGKISSTVIGVGINVNQETFPGLPRAASLKSITGLFREPGELLQAILSAFEGYLNMLRSGSLAEVKSRYEAHLFRLHQPSTFKDGKGTLFTGHIRGVTEEGKLLLGKEDGTIQSFALKEIEMLY